MGLHFTRFSLEMCERYSCDRLDISDDNTADALLIKRYCGNWTHLPEDTISTGNTLHVSFTSDRFSQSTGFRIRYYVGTKKGMTDAIGGSN